MTRVLLTGANGFIGSHVARALVAQGCEVHALVRQAGGGLWRLKDIESKLVFEKGDLTDPASLDRAIANARPEVCIHLAWYAAPGKYLHAIENLALVSATLDLARRLQRQCGRRHDVAGFRQCDIHTEFTDQQPLLFLARRLDKGLHRTRRQRRGR